MQKISSYRFNINKLLFCSTKPFTNIYMEINKILEGKEQINTHDNGKDTHKHRTTHTFYMVILLCYTLAFSCISGNGFWSIIEKSFEDSLNSAESRTSDHLIWQRQMPLRFFDQCVCMCGVVTLGWGWPLHWIHCRNTRKMVCSIIHLKTQSTPTQSVLALFYPSQSFSALIRYFVFILFRFYVREIFSNWDWKRFLNTIDFEATVISFSTLVNYNTSHQAWYSFQSLSVI